VRAVAQEKVPAAMITNAIADRERKNMELSSFFLAIELH